MPKRDLNITVSILERIEAAEQSRIFYEGEAVWPDGQQEWARPDWSNLEAFHVDLMEETGLLKKEVTRGEPWQNLGETDIHLVATNAGFEFLSDYRSNSVFRRFGRLLSSMASKIFVSVVTPVVVTVLTVLALNYFGLAN